MDHLLDSTVHYVEVVTHALHHLDLWVSDPGPAVAEWALAPRRARLGDGGGGRLVGVLGHPDGTYLFLERSPDLVDEPHDRLRPGVNHLALTVEDRPTLDRLRAESSSHGWHELFCRPLPPRRGRAAHRAVPGELGGVRGRGRPGRLTAGRPARPDGVAQACSTTSSVRSAASSTAPTSEARSPSSEATTGVERDGVEGVAAQADPGRLQQQLAGAGHVAADDDEGRVEQVDHAGQGPAQVQAGVLEGARAPRRCPSRAARTIVVDGRRRAAGRPSSPAGRRSRCRPPGSRGCRSGRAGPFSSRVRWPISPAVPPLPWKSWSSRTMPGADAGGDLHEDRGVVAAGDAVPVLGEGAEVGVVLDVHRDAEPLRGGLDAR